MRKSVVALLVVVGAFSGLAMFAGISGKQVPKRIKPVGKAATLSTPIAQGYVGNSQPCAAGTQGVALYTPTWRGNWGYYGLELVPENWGTNVTQRLRAGEIVLTVPTIDQRFVRVVKDLKFWFVLRSDLCLADKGVSAQVQSLAGGKSVPDMYVYGTPDATRLALAVEHMTHVPAAAQRAVDSRGGYGVLFTGSNITNVPGYEGWKNFQLLGPYANDNRTIEQIPGLSIGPNVNAGFGASVDWESASYSIPLHEYGHLYDYATGRSLTGDFLFGPQVEAQTCASKVSDSSASYFTGNALEWYAETFAQYLMSPERNANLKAQCPITWAYHRGTLGVPAF